MQLDQSLSVVIVGGGSSAWMAAAAYSKLLGAQVAITVVDTGAVDSVGGSESTLPSFKQFLQLLGEEEQDFMQKTQATYKLGSKFNDWAQRGESYMHAFGDVGKGHWACDFQHFWLRGKALGLSADFSDYCIEARAAEAGKMLNVEHGAINYGYHVDTQLWIEYLKDIAKDSGAIHIEAKIDSVQQSADGAISSLILADGKQVQGDLFIDCSGFEAELIEGVLASGYESYSDCLPCDSVVSLQTSTDGVTKALSDVSAKEAGWLWQTPLLHNRDCGYVFSSQHQSQQQALETLLANSEGRPISDPVFTQFSSGRRRSAWLKNCIAIGAAAGFLEPLESTSIHLAMSGIMRLLKLFPSTGCDSALQDEFNQQSQREFERIRDFLILHYKATEREDTEFWRSCQTMTIPESLAHRIALFKQSSVLTTNEEDTFQRDAWVQVLIGQHIMPVRYHTIVDLMSEDQLSRFLDGMRAHTNTVVGNLPNHHALLGQFCGSQHVAA